MRTFIPGGKQSCQELLAEFKAREELLTGEKIDFNDVDGRDVYNITAPFEDKGEMIIAGRVEYRDSEDSEVVFFVEQDGKWVPREGAPRFRLQDPFVTRINGELVFGGVEIFSHPEIEGALGWRTLFFRGKEINDLEKFATGPDGMKDIRLVELADGSVGIFTRPQGETGGRGTIGYKKINSIDELNEENINNSKLLNDQFITEEWGGANEVHLLKNGLLGVLGHIACFDKEGNRHYYPMVFAFDPVREVASSMKIIACRDNFPEGPAKRADLVDVLFSGGIIRNNDGTAVLYVGVSDVEAHKIIIPDPFKKYEEIK